jgi:hypothetical protein
MNFIGEITQIPHSGIDSTTRAGKNIPVENGKASL